VLQIQRLVVARVAVRGTERVGSGPRFERGAAFPDGVGRIERVVLGSGPLSRWNSVKPGTLSRWLSRDSQTFSKAASDPLATLKRFMAINIIDLLISTISIDL
jgi:hypothetical protein